ncbi:MAG TPA: YggT family protein [Candidatus Pseudogracilibacillus intestinigallinarum]|uniref:YggT family protein n=1 Tax=Candidatus Pseudogracilibacillus intestinigallinarum TaxID=2838742 RepID=A0A9D1PML6_9BACI|nr:YggT family protein [Candidatus Pseudogracilibacillus intestinigallinarum]
MMQLAYYINLGITLYTYVLIIYILMSWFPGARDTAFGEFVGRVCEPYLEQFRKFIPPLGMIDISPIAALFTLQLAKIGVIEIFRMLG